MDDILSTLRDYISKSPSHALSIMVDAFQAYPDRVLSIYDVALEVAPNQASALASAALQQSPQLAPEIAARAVRANPDQSDFILTAALQANPSVRQSTLDATIIESPRIERTLREIYRRHSGAADGPGGQTQIEQPAVEADSPQPYVPPAPIYRYLDEGDSRGNTATRGPAAQARSRPATPPPAQRRNGCISWFLIGLVFLVVVAVLGGAGYWVYGILTSAPAQPTALAITEVSNSQTQEAERLAEQLIAESTEQAALSQITPEATLSAESSATATLAPTAVEPSATATPAQPTFTALKNMFCRTGPSAVYEERRTLATNEQAPIIGRGISPVDNASVWWLVDKGNAECYVSDGLGRTEGDLSDVPFILAPATPTATPPATVAATPSPTP